MSRPRDLRPIRAGLVAFTVVSVPWLLLSRYVGSPRCASSSTAPFACLGAALLAAAVGVLLAFLAVAAGLAGKGLAHAVLGAFACLGGGLQLGLRVVERVPALGSQLAAVLVLATVIAVLTALWAWRIPPLGHPRRAGSARRSAGSGSRPPAPPR